MTRFDRAVDFALAAYKSTLSPLLGPRCRYSPTCSEYAAQALKGHGLVKGSWMAVRRVCRCHPLGGSGYDPVPEPSGAEPNLQRAADARRWKCDA
jgi:uncharacterized protein